MVRHSHLQSPDMFWGSQRQELGPDRDLETRALGEAAMAPAPGDGLVLWD